jgi:hypothetical protein
MAITKDQLAQLNFGYLTGQDLVQFCPTQLLTSIYEKYPDLLQTGVDMACDELRGALCNRYDIDAELYNANQSFKYQTGQITISIAAGTFVSRIYFNWNDPLPLIIQEAANNAIQHPIDNSPFVTIGTTLNGEDIMPSQQIDMGIVYNINRIFASATTLYLNITFGHVDIILSANSGVAAPPVTVVEMLNQTGAVTLALSANTYVYQVFAKILLSTPSIKIGTTAGGNDVAHLTLVSNATLTLLTQYFTSSATLYFTITGGSVDLRIDEGLNFVAPTPIVSTKKRDGYFVKVLSLFAIRNILGSTAGDNKKLQSDFDWAMAQVEMVLERQRSFKISTAPSPLKSSNELIKSSFKTLG